MTTYQALSREVRSHGATLVAVSKTHPPEAIRGLYEQGHRDFGENRAQELAEKQKLLPGDIRWHMIGHLQRNKVKDIAAFVHLIHAVDSLKLLEEIDKRAAGNDRTIDCLLQIKIAEEESKHGLSMAGARDLLESDVFQRMRHCRIRGVMGMATFTAETDRVRGEFKRLNGYFRELKADYFPGSGQFEHISMGMSGDYRLALAQGSTLVRVGSLLFGDRVAPE
jgi:PLP dependent protein